jgi:hypothetical protein
MILYKKRRIIMKSKKFDKKLAFRKKTIANLEGVDLVKARGGIETEPYPGTCLPNTCAGTCHENTCEYSCGTPVTCNGGPC